MRNRVPWVACVLVTMIACKGRGTHIAVDAGPPPPPAWLVRHFHDSTVTPYVDDHLDGLVLYEVEYSEIDLGVVYYAALDEHRHLVAGPDLFRRIARGRRTPAELARWALGTVITKSRSSDRPLGDAAECRASFERPSSWACELVSPPRLDGRALVFFAFASHGPSSVLVEHRVDLDTSEDVERSAYSIVEANGRVVGADEPSCRAVASCGSWVGCALVERIVGYGISRETHRRLDSDADAGAQRIVPENRCAPGGAPCLSAARVLDEGFEPALAAESEVCARRAAPTIAPFVCVPVERDERTVGCERRPR